MYMLKYVNVFENVHVYVRVYVYDLPHWSHVFLLLVAVSRTFTALKPHLCEIFSYIHI